MHLLPQYIFFLLENNKIEKQQKHAYKENKAI
jgi:hypothetical protein